jgi:outer membrane protein
MRHCLGACVLSVAILMSAAVHADQRPLWEFGLGATGLYLPDYRGADESRGYLYPIPYFIYRGDFFRADRDGIRGIFFESDRVELNVSLFGTVPVDSEKNQARQGMPDLDPTIEVGPLLSVTLARDKVKEWRLDFRLPVRAVIATDFSHAQNAGWVAYPHLNLDLRATFLDGQWNVGMQTGPLLATSKYHR